MLKEVYEDDSVTLKCVYEWFKRFREGHDSLEDADRSGRPATVRNAENCDKIKHLLA